uniref:PGF-CTERM archaeal protein-sorting signal domain-containing protein n=1 Tax=Candidatus Methanophaga sp. ANME-1 ERB7 TaxID=2759913 RepID=A0A7G9Z687_9EURY|nr:hypothetical protein DIJDKDOB_00002 [Methanosarcinales archaeon ANME-1 ERB7]
MKKKMDKIVWGILGFAIVAILTVPVAAQNEVYLVPMQSTATYCNTADVEIWVKAAEFQGGQIDLTYDSSCANVTGWERNTTNFLIGGWSHYDGRDWITFSTMDPQPVSLTGNYMIGTLMIHCVSESEEGCETALAFIEPSKLLDDRGDQVPTTRKDGTFRCLALTPAQASAVIPTPSSGGASMTHTTTTTPTPNLTPRQTLTPTPIATTSPLVTSAPTTSPEVERGLPGFEAVFAILGLLGISYLITKRGWKND